MPEIQVEITTYFRRHLFAKRKERKQTKTFIQYGQLTWICKETHEEVSRFDSNTKHIYEWLEQANYIGLFETTKKEIFELAELRKEMQK